MSANVNKLQPNDADAFITKAQELQRQSKIEASNTINYEKKWEWKYLRERCQVLELEPYFRTYMRRLISSYLCLFILITWLVMFLHSLLLVFVVDTRPDVYPDMTAYFAANVIICLVCLVTFFGKFVERNPWILYLCSWLIIATLVATDSGVVLYHGIESDASLRPSYAYFVLYSTYIFMPIIDNGHVIMLGLTATVAYITCFGYITYSVHTDEDQYMHFRELLSESIFLLCVNMIGFFTRLNKEVAIRTTFLDRRQCLEENLLFRYARDQEKGLLLRILPAQIANKIQQDLKLRIERQKQQTPHGQALLVELRKLFIEPHNDVTILYADLVNYTYLTTTLDVKTLVETIHDLFVKFDIASHRFNVLRIKFLGDCYYCVSGVPIPNEYHAKCCVDLALSMINDIRDVSQQRAIDIDMRIGVHSGSILSGVIGARKWQYDIWSKDVDIANRLEATGVAGRVHISEQTMKQLEGLYSFEEGTAAAKADEVLRKYEIHTYLIKISRETLETILQPAPSAESQIYKGRPSRGDNPVPLMKNAVDQLSQIRQQATLDMSREMDRMPISRLQVIKACCGGTKRLRADEIEEETLRKNITAFLLFFKDWRREIFYMNEPDAMFKYSILFGFITFICIVLIQAVAFRQTTLYWILMMSCMIMLFCCIIIAWYRKLWIMFVGETDSSVPTHKLSSVLFQLSNGIQKNAFARISVYVVLLGIQCIATLLQLINCDRIEVQNDNFVDNVLNKQPFEYQCFYPWSITNGFALIICTIFVFTRILFLVKLVFGTSMVLIYTSLVLFDYDIIYERSHTTNMRFPAEYTHLMVPLITLIVLHMMDRQSEFISKVDYNWKRQLLKKQNDAMFTNETIKILINNILPAHVADIYIAKQMQHELYYEEYENVAIMFATIRNYDAENFGLRILNEIICDFDEILNFYSGPFKIEKIKVAGWTYMAACGLDVERSESFNALNEATSSLLYNRHRSPVTEPRSFMSTKSSIASSYHSFEDADKGSTSSPHPEHLFDNVSTRSRQVSPPQYNNVVYIMAKFALDLMRTLRTFNTESLQIDEHDPEVGMLRIGISNGEVMAGVVGSYKPHYDIWGNAVNMASRLDSTGVPGSIQVTENTAHILESYGVKCFYRGMTYIKGRGDTPTYFVGIDQDLNFIPKDREKFQDRFDDKRVTRKTEY